LTYENGEVPWGFGEQDLERRVGKRNLWSRKKKNTRQKDQRERKTEVGYAKHNSTVIWCWETNRGVSPKKSGPGRVEKVEKAISRTRALKG